MKTNESKFLNKFFGAVALSLLLVSVTFLSSCEKEEEETTQSVSEEEAAEVVIASVEGETAGMTEQVEEAVIVMETEIDPATDCGLTKNGTISGSNLSGALVTYNYNFSRSYTLTCDDNTEPQTLTYAFNGVADYNAPRMASDDQVTASATLTGLSSASATITFNQSYQRSGSQQSKIRNKRSFTSNLLIESSNLVVNKNTYKIESGTASISIDGAASDGSHFSYNGTIVFYGNEKATLSIDGGAEYIINL